MNKKIAVLGLGLALAGTGCAMEPATSSGGPAGTSGSFTASAGSKATEFKMPSDMRLAIERELPKEGYRYERWQQEFGGAKVLGAQITLHRDATGTVSFVAGSHYDVTPSNSIKLSAAQAIEFAAAELADNATHDAALHIDPHTGRYFYEIDSHAEGVRVKQWIDADDGSVLNSYDALTTGCVHNPGGVGFDGSDLDLNGLTSNGLLQTTRQRTYDLGSQKKPFYGSADYDADGCWDAPGRKSPGQGALVSAQYHVSLADSYYQTQHSFDLTAHLPSIVVWGHYDVNYVNAYWDGTKLVFGDGDGTNYTELVGLDVAAHEFSHAVTEFNADLIYQNESGALNESFSDIMGATVGFETGIDPDWLMGDDNDANPDDGLGFRDMSDPAAHGDPAHWCNRYTGTGDNGGVHINSGIPNHAFYLLVSGNGAFDATALGATEAERRTSAANIFYAGFTALPSNATFLQARAATVAAAETIGVATATAVAAAWTAVGVDVNETCGTTTPPAENCTDGIDNDGDGAIDCADSDCAAEPTCAPPSTCELGGSGDSCSDNTDCCSGLCSTKGKKASFTCK